MKQDILEKLIDKYDKSNMYDYLKSFHKQITEVEDLFANSNIVNDKQIYNNIVVCGMGGSSIGGEFVKNIIDNELEIPFIINNNYCLPNFVNKDTLLIIVSYSGNTEEMISCYNESKEKNINPYILTSGGYLLKEAKTNNLNFIKIPQDYPPRVAFGFMSTILFKLLIEIKLISNSINEEIKLAANTIHKCSVSLANSYRDNIIRNNFKYDDWDQTKDIGIYSSDINIHPLRLAEILYERKSEIFIYTSPKTKTIGYRFKCQLAENTKIISNINSVPEMNHNEIEGYKNINLKDAVIFWLSDYYDLDENIKNIDNSYKVIETTYRPQQIRLSFRNIRYISGQYLLLYYLDWVSYYLALLYETDPTPVQLIQKLKSMS